MRKVSPILCCGYCGQRFYSQDGFCQKCGTVRSQTAWLHADVMQTWEEQGMPVQAIVKILFEMVGGVHGKPKT